MNKEERQEAAHHAAGDVESALLVAHCSEVATGERVFLNQERVVPTDYSDGTWILDTGHEPHDRVQRRAGRT